MRPTEDVCDCLNELHKFCNHNRCHCHNYDQPQIPIPKFMDEAAGGSLITIYDADAEFGRIMYTLSILLMFSFVIVLLMVRSIKRSSNTMQMETLLDAMRFREELDLRERQRRRLLKAKGKVTAWLTRTTGDGPERLWRSSPQLMQNIHPRRQTTSTITSEIPEIVVTTEPIKRPHTPCLSLIYDFSSDQRDVRKSSGCSTRSSVCSEISTGRESLGSQRMSLSLDTNESPNRHKLAVNDHSLSIE